MKEKVVPQESPASPQSKKTNYKKKQCKQITRLQKQNENQRRSENERRWKKLAKKDQRKIVQEDQRNVRRMKENKRK